MTDTTYNGWTNYATWRISLEIFNEGRMAEFCYEAGMAVDDITGDWAEEWVEELLFGDRDTDGLVESYARSFISGVNWYEIASHIAEDVKELEGSEDD